MRQRNMMNGSDIEQTCQGFFFHPVQGSYDNNSMWHQRASDLGAGMSAAPSFYPSYAALHAPPSHILAHGSQDYYMDHGYKRKTVVAPGNPQYITTAEAAAPCYFPQLNTPETTPYSFPQFGAYSQPLDHRSVRNSVEAATMNPLPSHAHNSFIQGNYAAHPGSIWYDQHCNRNIYDRPSPLWSQAPYVPYMHGNAVTGSIDSGNVYFPRSHGPSSSSNPTPAVYHGHNYVSHHLAPPPPTVYCHMASASYTVPEARHDASYSHVGPVQSNGFRINQQHNIDTFEHGETLRDHILPQFREIFPLEYAGLGEGDFYNAVNYGDLHQDMRLDIDDMSYEELLSLSDQIGNVRTGLSEEDVEDFLKRRTSLSTRINLEEAPSTDLETNSCTICQESYKNQDKIATLDCKHEYHAECLKKWLVIKNICPICKSDALVKEKKTNKKV
ncbi:unnamed protein product [Cochlearia groenlandica]